MRLRACLFTLLGAAAGCAHREPSRAATATPHPFAAAADHLHPADAAEYEPIALFDDLGHHHRPIATRSPEAQRYFDQGLTLFYSFHHKAAIRSFREAARRDGTCAMCWWGVALAHGPHINRPGPLLPPDTDAVALAALDHARASSSHAPPVERELVEALATRFAPNTGPDRRALNEEYASAMRRVWQAHPRDADIGSLFAEAMMNLRPWDFWTPEGDPQPGTTEILATLERVLALDPEHPGANHLYIHAVEASRDPGRALASADRLSAGLVPGAGHMAHMPAHVYMRMGRYEEASEANRRAIQVDGAHAPREQGFYLMTYRAHNFQFLAWSAMAEGRSAEAIQAARGSVALVPVNMIEASGPMQQMYDFMRPLPLLVLVRFGRWDEILREPPPEPQARLPFALALWHYSRGLAQAAQGRIEQAIAERAAFERIAAKVDADAYAGNNSPRAVLGIASDVLDARLAERRGRTEDAVMLLERAVAAEDALRYDEPADWPEQPVRQRLGALLLVAGRPVEAERVFREDLKRNPENGWSLHGLWQALRAQTSQREDVDGVKRRAEAAWAHADVKLVSSAF